MNPREVLRELQGLRMLPYFPGESEHVWTALVALVGSMCSSIEQVRWLVQRMTSGIYAQWPGPQELRACFCCRFKPKDGVSAFSSVYPDGLPPDPTAPPRPELAAGSALKLAAGELVSADPALARRVALLARTKDLDRLPRRGNSTPPTPDYRPITQADIDAAVQEHRNRKALEESD